MVLKKSAILVVLLTCLQASVTFGAPQESVAPSTITMKSFSTFIVNDREVASADLIKALKKQKIPTNAPLVIEVPANTSMDIIKDLTERLATAGYKPLCRGPRHADASVVTQKGASTTVPPPQKKKRQQ